MEDIWNNHRQDAAKTHGKSWDIYHNQLVQDLWTIDYSTITVEGGANPPHVWDIQRLATHEPRKNTLTFHYYIYWLFNRDPHNGLL